MTWLWIYLIIGGVLTFILSYYVRGDERVQESSPGTYATVFLIGTVAWPLLAIVFVVLIVRRIISHDISKRG